MSMIHKLHNLVLPKLPQNPLRTFTSLIKYNKNEEEQGNEDEPYLINPPQKPPKKPQINKEEKEAILKFSVRPNPLLENQENNHENTTLQPTLSPSIPLEKQMDIIKIISDNMESRKTAAMSCPKQQYYSMIDHITNVVRHGEIAKELDRMRVPVNSETVYRVLRNSKTMGKNAYRFFLWAKNKSGYEPTTVEYEEMVSILGGGRHWVQMWKMVDEIRNAGYPLTPNVFGIIIEAYGKAGFHAKSVDVFNQMVEYKVPHTLQVYNSLLKALCQANNLQGGYALIDRMIHKGCHPDRQTYEILVSAWCIRGRMDEARQFLESMSRRGFEPPVGSSSMIVNGLLSAGKLDLARDAVYKMNYEGYLPDVQTFNKLLEALYDSGQSDICLKLFSKFGGSKGIQLDKATYVVMTAAASKSEKLDEAFSFLNDAMENGIKPFPSLYAPLLKALCKNGQFSKAFALFKEVKIRGHSPNRPIYTMLIRLTCYAGRLLDATNLLVEMLELKMIPIETQFSMVIDRLKKTGNYNLAEKLEKMYLKTYKL